MYDFVPFLAIHTYGHIQTMATYAIIYTDIKYINPLKTGDLLNWYLNKQQINLKKCPLMQHFISVLTICYDKIDLQRNDTMLFENDNL